MRIYQKLMDLKNLKVKKNFDFLVDKTFNLIKRFVYF